MYLPIISATGRKRPKVNFKHTTTGLNLEFSFSSTSCLTKVEKPSPFYYLPQNEGGKWIHAFRKGIRANWNKQLHSGFELWLPNPFPIMITVTLSTTPPANPTSDLMPFMLHYVPLILRCATVMRQLLSFLPLVIGQNTLFISAYTGWLEVQSRRFHTRVHSHTPVCFLKKYIVYSFVVIRIHLWCVRIRSVCVYTNTQLWQHTLPLSLSLSSSLSLSLTRNIYLSISLSLYIYHTHMWTQECRWIIYPPFKNCNYLASTCRCRGHEDLTANVIFRAFS